MYSTKVDDVAQDVAGACWVIVPEIEILAKLYLNTKKVIKSFKPVSEF